MSYLPTGAGTYLLNSSIGSSDTTILLSSFLEPISLTPYTMANIGTDIVYATIAPKTANSEFISFTGITQNADGTALLTGVTRGLSRSTPFTSSATFKLPHSGQSQLILSNSPQQINEYVTKRGDQTISGQITFSQPPIGINPGGAADASTTVKGISKVSCAPVSATSPIALGENDARVPTSNQAAALVGTGTPSGGDLYVNRSTLTSEEAAFELLANKDTTTTLGISNTKYPSQNAVKVYVDNQTTNVYLGTQNLSTGANTITAGYQSAWKYCVIKVTVTVTGGYYMYGDVILYKTGKRDAAIGQFLSGPTQTQATYTYDGSTTITLAGTSSSGVAYYYQ